MADQNRQIADSVTDVSAGILGLVAGIYGGQEAGKATAGGVKQLGGLATDAALGQPAHPTEVPGHPDSHGSIQGSHSQHELVGKVVGIHDDLLVVKSMLDLTPGDALYNDGGSHAVVTNDIVTARILSSSGKDKFKNGDLLYRNKGESLGIVHIQQ